MSFWKEKASELGWSQGQPSQAWAFGDPRMPAAQAVDVSCFHPSSLDAPLPSAMSCCTTVSSVKGTVSPPGKLLKQKGQRPPAPSTNPTPARLTGQVRVHPSFPESALKHGRPRQGWGVHLGSLQHSLPAPRFLSSTSPPPEHLGN